MTSTRLETGLWRLISVKGAKPADETRSTYHSVDDDPQLIWRPDRDQRARLEFAAAVEITWSGSLVEGRFVDPCLYIDWGDGFGEGSKVSLRRDDTGHWRAAASAQGPFCNAIRLDPSAAQCTFQPGELDVGAVGRLSFSPAVKLRARIRRHLGPLRPVVGLARRVVRQSRRTVVGRVRSLVERLVPNPWRRSYETAVTVSRAMRSKYFAAPAQIPMPPLVDAPRLLAFYLPQFHPIPENDRWWGRGFTEWANVSKAVPQFTGHLQPRRPADLGYYDLRVGDVIRQQIDLAKLHGVSGFCFHYYWFAGHRLLERPLDAFVADKSHDFPFALCWANENWTRRWDGRDSEVLIQQDHSAEDDLRVFDDLLGYMRDDRYVKVDGRPVLIVYRPDILPDAKATADRWRRRAEASGLPGIHLLCTTAFGFSDYGLYGFDGIVQFPPHAISTGDISESVERLNPGFAGKVYDYPLVVEKEIERLSSLTDPNILGGAIPGWDNEARKPGAGHVFHGATPALYHQWIKAIVGRAARAPAASGKLAFVNAWNEWAEGAYLEPDTWFGHGYLQATRAAMEQFAPRDRRDMGAGERASDDVFIVHLFYPEMIALFAERLKVFGLDIIVTCPDTWTEAETARLHEALPRARILHTPNNGRDLGPFLVALRVARQAGYRAFCKLHSKRSPHMADGGAWRDQLLDGVVSPTRFAEAQLWLEDPTIGLIAPARSKVFLSEPAVMFHNRSNVDDLAERLGVRPGAAAAFPAGSMYWGRIDAFARLIDRLGAPFDFGPELGQIDGTAAHALERLIGVVVEAGGFKVRWSD